MTRLQLLLLLFSVLGLPALVPAQPSGRGATDLLRQAEEKVREGDFQEAERLYLQGLGSADPSVRRQSYDQVLAFYTRMGRPDRAIQTGLHYEKWLQAVNDRARRRELQLQLGEWLFTLGHWRESASRLEQVLSDPDALEQLPATRLLNGLIALARGAENRNAREKALGYWLRVEKLAQTRLRDVRPPLSLTQRVECSWLLDDSYRSQKLPARGLECLEPLLPLHDQLRDLAGKGETLRRLAVHHTARKNDSAAEQCLRQGLALFEKNNLSAPVLQGDLLAALAEVVQRQQPEEEKAEPKRLKEQAIACYESALKAKPGSVETTTMLTAFWKLQQYYQNDRQYEKALQLAASQADLLGPLLQPRVKAEQGTLQVNRGAYQEAQAFLRAAVAEMEKQDPPNLVELPRALNNLAIAEQATDLPRAEKWAQQCLALYVKYEMPPDLVQVETYNLLGTCAALNGYYAKGIEHLRNGMDLCVELGKQTAAVQNEELRLQAGKMHSNLLLNEALLHKAQGDLDRALTACEKAQAVSKQFAQPDAREQAAYDAARASIYAAQGKIADAYARVKPILDFCNQHEGEDVRQLRITALHCQALHHASPEVKEFDQAEATWRRVLELQQQENQTVLLPRTHNYLGLTAELRGRLAEADKHYLEADRLQKETQGALPATRFITHWRRAGVLDRLGQRAQARKLLEQAITVVEEARLKTYGESQERATYYAQFAPAFDQLVRWSVQDGDLESAFSAMARGRSRTLLDQLQTAGIDPREALQGPEGEKLRRREEELRQRISALRARAQLIPVNEKDKEAAKKLIAAFEEAQKDLMDVRREIVNLSPKYRALAVEDPSAKALAVLRGLGPKTVLLVYHLGREQGYVFLGRAGKLEAAFPLTIPKDLALRVAPPAKPSVLEALLGSRGMFYQVRQQPQPAPPPAEEGPTVPLTHAVAQAVAESYRQQVADPQFEPTRAFVLTPRKGQKVPPQRLELLANVLLPPEVRRRIREAAPDKLLVVPDGPMHKLPLESLLVEGGERPRYLLDELPPIVYTPSLSILAVLTERQAPKQGPLSLLTVCDPAYPEPHGAASLALGLMSAFTVNNPLYPEWKATGNDKLEVMSAVGLRGQLPRLPFTGAESRRIRDFFNAKDVTVLEGPRATKAAVIANVPGRRVLHLAVHGFADDRFGNLFGALALTPPAQGMETPENDGFLSLHEIYTLNLQECELAVLSACVTNVGPQRPLEAGVTLASGFLAAGAHRVIASHWEVNDASTAELMGAFFKEVTDASQKGEPVSYARALRNAQLHVRGKVGWSSPYYWAPFVLLGPED